MIAISCKEFVLPNDVNRVRLMERVLRAIPAKGKISIRSVSEAVALDAATVLSLINDEKSGIVKGLDSGCYLTAIPVGAHGRYFKPVPAHVYIRACCYITVNHELVDKHIGLVTLAGGHVDKAMYPVKVQATGQYVAGRRRHHKRLQKEKEVKEPEEVLIAKPGPNRNAIYVRGFERLEDKWVTYFSHEAISELGFKLLNKKAYRTWLTCKPFLEEYARNKVYPKGINKAFSERRMIKSEYHIGGMAQRESADIKRNIKVGWFRAAIVRRLLLLKRANNATHTAEDDTKAYRTYNEERKLHLRWQVIKRTKEARADVTGHEFRDKWNILLEDLWEVEKPWKPPWHQSAYLEVFW